MRIFIVDGKERTFADVICENSAKFDSLLVASYGFGVRQVEKLLSVFREVVLVADESHSVLNRKAFESVLSKSEHNEKFSFLPSRTHAKLALIDNETIIVTSANLSSNRKIELYLIGSAKEVDGIDELKKFFGDPDEVFGKTVGDGLDDIDWEKL